MSNELADSTQESLVDVRTGIADIISKAIGWDEPVCNGEIADQVLAYLKAQGWRQVGSEELPRSCDTCKHHHCFIDGDTYAADCSCDLSTYVLAAWAHGAIPTNCPLKNSEP